MYRPKPATIAGDRAISVSSATALSAGLSAGIVVTSWEVTTTLGVPAWWPWLLTGLQVAALWAAGAKRRWGWLLGAAVQPPWIVYALLTDQLGFIPGCVVSAAVQAYSFVRQTSSAPRRAERVRGDRHEPGLVPCAC